MGVRHSDWWVPWAIGKLGEENKAKTRIKQSSENVPPLPTPPPYGNCTCIWAQLNTDGSASQLAKMSVF